MALTARDRTQIKLARKHGIVNPEYALTELKRQRSKPEGLDYALLCAVLMEESSGGHNVFGHDPTIFVGAGTVSKTKYMAYRKLRNAVHKFQGVGGMQLTYGAYQDDADKAGGCWLPQFQMRIGIGVLSRNIAKYGLWGGVAAYNGTGDAARAYANAVLTIRQTFEHLLSGAKLDPEALADFAVEEDLKVLTKIQKDYDSAVRNDPFWLPH